MVELTDITLLECNGQYESVVEIMKKEAAPGWVILTKALVSTELITASYELEFWHNGCIIILTTDHPASIKVPDEDIRELHNWVTGNGWASIGIHQRMLSNPMDFEFWKRMYQSGLIQSDLLKEYDDDEMTRMTKALDKPETNYAT